MENKTQLGNIPNITTKLAATTTDFSSAIRWNFGTPDKDLLFEGGFFTPNNFEQNTQFNQFVFEIEVLSSFLDANNRRYNLIGLDLPGGYSNFLTPEANYGTPIIWDSQYQNVYTYSYMSGYLLLDRPKYIEDICISPIYLVETGNFRSSLQTWEEIEI